VLFTDIAGFTPYCRTREPEEIVDNLHRLFTAFEEYAVKYELEKIKTIGDSFMAACGLLSEVENPVKNCVCCALEMIEAAQTVTREWQLRVGVHCGPIVAGVLGSRKQQYDLWGDTVNVASRMESHGVPGFVALSETAWNQISDLGEADFSQRIHVKGLGEQQVFVFRRFL
jgi:class 3 adenylate cyclase